LWRKGRWRQEQTAVSRARRRRSGGASRFQEGGSEEKVEVWVIGRGRERVCVCVYVCCRGVQSRKEKREMKGKKRIFFTRGVGEGAPI
jgi:hypothetical protein